MTISLYNIIVKYYLLKIDKIMEFIRDYDNFCLNNPFNN